MKFRSLLFALILFAFFDLSANNSKWVPINIEFESMAVNSAISATDGYIYGVGDYGTIRKGTEETEFEIIRGDYSFDNLNEILEIDGILFAFGDNFTIIFSANNGSEWNNINFSENSNIISATTFNNYIYFTSESKIFSLNPKTFEINIIYDDFSEINKLFSHNNYMFVIGDNGLLATFNKENKSFDKININTSNNISEIIGRNNKLIIFPNMEYPIYTENYFKDYKSLKSENAMGFVKHAAWIGDSLIVAIASKTNLGGYTNAFSTDLLNNWVVGNYDFPPNINMIGYNNYSLLTGDRGAIIMISEDNIDMDNFQFFDNFISLGNKPFKFFKLNNINDKLYCSGNARVYSYDIFNKSFNLEIENGVTNLLDIEKFENTYYFLTQNKKIINGRQNYINFIIKYDSDIKDTIYQTELSSWSLNNIKIIDNKIISYGNKDTIISINLINHKLSKIIVPGYIWDCSIDNNSIHLLLINENNEYFYTSTTDFGETFSEYLTLEKNGKLLAKDENIYYLTYDDNTQILYNLNNNFQEIKRFSSSKHFNLNNIYAYNDLIVIGGKDSVYFSTDSGNSWNYELFGQYKTWDDITGIENYIFVLSGYNIYHKKISITSKVSELFVKDYNILIYPNPAEDYIEITINKPSCPDFIGAEGSEIEIYNVLGDVQINYEFQITNYDSPHKIDISHLPRGVYFVRVGNNVEKFVKR